MNWELEQIKIADRIVTLAATPGAVYTVQDARHLTLTVAPTDATHALLKLERACKFMRRGNSWMQDGAGVFYITLY